MYKILGIEKIKANWNSSTCERNGTLVARTTRCNPTKEDACGPCKEVILLGRRILEMEKALFTLKAIQASNNTKVNIVHDPLSRLPIELVSNIFMYLRPLPMDMTYSINVDKPDDIARSMKTPLLLGAVCRAWRAFAWSIPQLWSTISVNVYNENDDAPDIIRQWLARSGQLPLSIYLYIARRRLDGGLLSPHPYGNEPFVERLLAVINEYSERWFYLNLDIPKRFIQRVHCNDLEAPTLETLALQMRVDDGIEDAYVDSYRDKIELGTTPNLRRIHICPTLNFDSVDMDWTSVTHVEA